MLMRLWSLIVPLMSLPASACDLVPPIRQPTLAEQLGGVDEIFGGMVIGYVAADGSRVFGPPPIQCLENGRFRWWDELGPECLPYENVSVALFRVDVAVVGPAVGETASHFMTWGDGDCDIDFNVGEQWLIAGPVTERLTAPIRPDEVLTLQRLAAGPAFDMRQLYSK